jgi:serine/threonine-protein kinase mTOR
MYDGRSGRTDSMQMCHFAVEQIVRQLLTMAAADMDPAVRRAIVECFVPAFTHCKGSSKPDEYGLLMFFAQVESANALTLCLNDPTAAVRLAALTIMGKIARYNPAVSFPVLRRHLQQLLGDFQSAADSARLDETALLLSGMIAQCPELVLPNLHTIQDKLAKKLDHARERIREHGGKSKSGHSMTDSIMQVRTRLTVVVTMPLLHLL